MNEGVRPQLLSFERAERGNTTGFLTTRDVSAPLERVFGCFSKALVGKRLPHGTRNTKVKRWIGGAGAFGWISWVVPSVDNLTPVDRLLATQLPTPSGLS